MFEETHRLALSLVREGAVDGLRIDHPDGLADPAGYLERLRDGGVEHVWIEKILDPGEKLRDWPVEGTVGYEFLNDVAALFVDPAGEARADRAVGRGLRRRAAVRRGRATRPSASRPRHRFTPEVERLRRLHDRRRPRRGAGLAAGLPHLHPRRPGRARGCGGPARGRASSGCPTTPPEFVTRFQQTTPPVMAKGVEDTAFYRYGRLLALNDVGGDPSRFGISVEAFHAGNRERAERFPRNLLVTQTHDTKRSGDVRARIGALAGMAEEWEAHVRTWLSLLEDVPGPDGAERYFIFQTLVGAWPIEPERLEAYMEKAMREAKRNTNWIEPDEAHEAAVKAFCRGLYEHEAFLRRLRAVRRRGGARGRARGARPAAAQADRAGRARHLQRRRAALAVAGRPRQPPPGRLGRAPRRARRAGRRRRAGPRDGEAARHPARAGAARAAAGGVRGRLHAGRRRPERVRVRARRGRGARRGAGARHLAGHDAQAPRRARPGRGATCSRARCASSRAAPRCPSSPRRTGWRCSSACDATSAGARAGEA